MARRDLSLLAYCKTVLSVKEEKSVNKKKNRHKWDKKELKAAYLFTLPSFIGFMCFVLIPIIWVIVISFHKYNVFTGASTFVGMENYKKIFTDVRSLTALKNTLWYTICCSLGNTAIGLILAVLVDNILPKKITVFLDLFISFHH